MSLLDAVEYVTTDPAQRISLHDRLFAENQNVGVAKDRAYLERRSLMGALWWAENERGIFLGSRVGV
jgi:hypothetical protein